MIKELTEKELNEALDFFENNEISILEKQAIKFNKKQPTFTGLIYAFEMHGYTRDKTEEILESIFVIYYAYTEILKIEINTISIGQIKKNQQSFSEFIELYNKEYQYEDKIDLVKFSFIKNKAVLNYAVQKLLSIFESVEKFPNEITFPYFALLKAINMGMKNI